MMNVLIADDHEVVRRGLKDVLREEFADLNAGEAGDFQEVLKLAGATAWDLIILDIIMPGPGITEVLAAIRKIHPTVPVLVLTGVNEHEYAVTTLKAGANGYVTKQYVSKQLIKAVRKVMAGETYLSQEALAVVTSNLRGEESGKPHERLSPRELEIFCLIASGKSVKEIAGDLDLSDKTVGTHIARIKEKTGFASYVEMTRYAILHKLVD